MVRPSLIPSLLAAFLGVQGCAARCEGPVQPWRFEARTTHGVVRVLPVIVDHAPVDVSDDDYLGAGLTWLGEWLRSEREAEAARIPHALGRALPGALSASLGPAWDGAFLNGRFPTGARTGVKRALLAGDGLDDALEAVVRGQDGSVLVTWVTGLKAHALTDDGFPGDVLDTSVGPVVVDQVEQPFLVEAVVGMALVAPDGEVVLRYTDVFGTVLSARRAPEVAARELAQGLADEVALVWATDPRLEPGVPSDGVALLP